MGCTEPSFPPIITLQNFLSTHSTSSPIFSSFKTFLVNTPPQFINQYIILILQSLTSQSKHLLHRRCYYTFTSIIAINYIPFLSVLIFLGFLCTNLSKNLVRVKSSKGSPEYCIKICSKSFDANKETVG